MRAFLVGLVFASGCFIDETVTQPPTSDPQPRTARQMFDEDVFPVLVDRCSGCHTSPSAGVLGLMTTDAATTYKQAVADQGLAGDFTPANAPILKISRNGGHASINYTSDEVAKITAWLQQETHERQ